MIRDEQQWSIVRGSLDVFKAVDVHDVVSGEMDPAGAEGALAPRPKSLPGALIHAPHESESETFEWGYGFKLIHRLFLAAKRHKKHEQ